MLQDKAYAKLLTLADQIGSYDRFLSVSEEAEVEKLETHYVKARYWIVAALASGRGEPHERLARLDQNLDAIRTRQLYPEAAIDRVRQDLRDDLTAYVEATPFQRFVRTWLRPLMAVAILVVVWFLWFGNRIPT